jgi:hypothetical protein
VVNYTDEPVQTKRGRPRVHIPEEIAEWCEHTYRKGVSCELPLDEDAPEAPSVLRALRIYANRQGRSLFHEFTVVGGQSHLRFQMRDKRRYGRPELPEEQQ